METPAVNFSFVTFIVDLLDYMSGWLGAIVAGGFALAIAVNAVKSARSIGR